MHCLFIYFFQFPNFSVQWATDLQQQRHQLCSLSQVIVSVTVFCSVGRYKYLDWHIIIFHSEKITGTKTDLLQRFIMGNVGMFSPFESHSEYLPQVLNVIIQLLFNAKPRTLLLLALYWNYWNETTGKRYKGEILKMLNTFENTSFEPKCTCISEYRVIKMNRW